MSKRIALTVDQAAEITGCSHPTIYAAVKRGELHTTCIVISPQNAPCVRGLVWRSLLFDVSNDQRTLMEASDGRSRRAERSRQATRSRILDESRRVLRSGVLFDLTVQSLAKELGLSRVTIYQYFPTIRDILKALSDETIGMIFSNLPDVPATERRYLEKFVSLALEVFLSDSLLVRNLVLATEMGNSVSGWFRGDLEELLEHVVGQLDPEMRPVSSDPAQSARVMVTYFRGALYGWAAGFIDDETFASEVRRAATLTSTAK